MLEEPITAIKGTADLHVAEALGPFKEQDKEWHQLPEDRV